MSPGTSKPDHPTKTKDTNKKETKKAHQEQTKPGNQQRQGTNKPTDRRKMHNNKKGQIGHKVGNRAMQTNPQTTPKT
jgi:hypothetical protein